MVLRRGYAAALINIHKQGVPMQITFYILAALAVTAAAFFAGYKLGGKPTEEAAQNAVKAGLYDEEKAKSARLEEELNAQRASLRQSELAKADLDARADALQDSINKQKEFFEKIQGETKNAIKTMAADALKEQRTELINKNTDLYAPLKQKLDEFTKQIGDLRNESTSRHGDLKHALEQTRQMNDALAKEAKDLTEALKNPKMQGNWGEMILENVLTSAGLAEGKDYEKQAFLRGEDNSRNYPDFLIHLPQGRTVVIDSKMSLVNYKNWAVATDEAEKDRFLKAHVKDVRAHIDELAAKEYQNLLKDRGLDFVFMFIPIEYAYFAALQADPQLNEYARQKGVSVVTASNLFAVMQVVENLWRMERTNKNMDKILALGAEMHQRVSRFVTRMEDINTKLQATRKSYDDAMTSLTGNVGIIKSAVKLEEMQIKHARSLAGALNDTAPLLTQENNTQKPENL